MTTLAELHDRYKGERIWILGTGPSLLTQLPLLAKLKHEYTMGCNALPQWAELPFTPTFYGVTDLSERKQLENLRFPGRAMRRFNVQWPHRSEVHHPDFVWVEKAVESVQVHSHGFAGLGATLPPLPTGRTTPITLAQLAAWMGFKELYFLGIEQTRGYAHAPEQTMSMTGRQKFPLDKNPKFQHAIQRCAARMRADLEAAGRKVFDCTPGGLLTGTGEPRRGVNHKLKVLPYKELSEVLLGKSVLAG